MKNIFISTILLFGLTMILPSTSKAQEIVKPVKNHSVKKSDPNQGFSTKSELKHQSETEQNHQANTSNSNSANNSSQATKDSPDYQNKKTEWIKNNPEKYKQICGNPNLVILTEEQFNALSPEEKVRVEADPANYLIIR